MILGVVLFPVRLTQGYPIIKERLHHESGLLEHRKPLYFLELIVALGWHRYQMLTTVTGAKKGCPLWRSQPRLSHLSLLERRCPRPIGSGPCTPGFHLPPNRQLWKQLSRLPSDAQLVAFSRPLAPNQPSNIITITYHA
jgi:hypothetical protein